MKEHLFSAPRRASSQVDCGSDPVGSLVQMFVKTVQDGRIQRGQCPALRPVFLKPHGIAQGVFRVRPNLPRKLRVGIFAGNEYPLWARFSSDTLPTVSDFKTTLGLGLKLFNAPTPKIFGRPDDTTFDFIFQNFDVFFVDTASDMCAFTKAGVIDGDYSPYLKAHPRTSDLLDAMAQPVASVLGSAYWSCVPFAFGDDRFVKYKLEPTVTVPAPTQKPLNPTYLEEDLCRRLKSGDVRFRFLLQFRTDPKTMPLDQATVRWKETSSRPVHVADIILHKQDINARGQSSYGENLSFNIWRVTKEHSPQGTLAEARKAVYAASAQLRRDVNGIPTGEPECPKPSSGPASTIDTTIVRAAIHPAIGIARIGDSAADYFLAPEALNQPIQAPDYYRDRSGGLKRQATRFRIYGYNAAGHVVRELTSESAQILWKVHLSNKKAAWYQFQAALDLPDAKSLSVPLRNAGVPKSMRHSLVVDPGPRSIGGESISGGKKYRFDTGKFKNKKVYLGEICTDDNGRLIVLGGKGLSQSPSNAPIYNDNDPNTFNNADDWHDDVSDGPVTAEVSIEGRPLIVDSAWVVVAPPNYAPEIIGWRTMYDLLVDAYIECGWMEMPKKISFREHVLPILERLSNLQWVNKGFAAVFGKGRPLDFSDQRLIAKLANAPGGDLTQDPFAELRQVILNAFRPSGTTADEPRLWPWIYGDAYGSFSPSSDNNLKLSPVRKAILERWALGDFVDDWQSGPPAIGDIDTIPLGDQPEMLDRAALTYCLADAFHPGCEMTWIMRHTSLFERPFRVRHRAPSAEEPDYGALLTQQLVFQPNGPLYAQGPGDITRWMGLPWQGDTAFCRSGYEYQYDPYMPTFWPARVPNQVLTLDDYNIVINDKLPRVERLKAFSRRAHWVRALKGKPAEAMLQMVADFGAMGIVEARPGVKNDPDFPAIIFVESLKGSRLKKAAEKAARAVAESGHLLTAVERAGWESQERFEEFQRARVRRL